jgi:hypothetical protein
MKKMALSFICLLLLMIPPALSGQGSSSTADPALKSTQFDTSGFPLWAKDLRRAEIVAFGSFPFTFFFATFAVDTYRSASHNWDMRYAPWPLKSSGAIEMSQDELLITMSIAATGSVVLSLADYLIVKYKQHKRERELEKLTGESPIILRSPRFGGGEPSEGEAPEDVSPDNPVPADSEGSTAPLGLADSVGSTDLLRSETSVRAIGGPGAAPGSS